LSIAALVVASAARRVVAIATLAKLTGLALAVAETGRPILADPVHTLFRLVTTVRAVAGCIFNALPLGASFSLWTILCSCPGALVRDAVPAFAAFVSVAGISISVAAEEAGTGLATDDGGIATICVRIATGSTRAVYADTEHVVAFGVRFTVVSLAAECTDAWEPTRAISI